MKWLFALLFLTALAACGAVDDPSVEGGMSLGSFWRS